MLPPFKRLGVFLSGGLDSTALLLLAVRAVGASSIVALTAATELAEGWEQEASAELCGKLGVLHVPVEVSVLAVPEIKANGPSRCYHCKRLLCAALMAAGRARGVDLFCDGSTAEDSPEDRPGMTAAMELGVHSPLAAIGLRREDIRRIVQGEFPELRLVRGSCMATRTGQGIELDAHMIGRLRALEKSIRSLGLPLVRARWDGVRVKLQTASGHVDRATNLRVALDALAFAHGFDQLVIDLNGYSGEQLPV